MCVSRAKEGREFLHTFYKIFTFSSSFKEYSLQSRKVNPNCRASGNTDCPTIVSVPPTGHKVLWTDPHPPQLHGPITLYHNRHKLQLQSHPMIRVLAGEDTGDLSISQVCNHSGVSVSWRSREGRKNVKIQLFALVAFASLISSYRVTTYIMIPSSPSLDTGIDWLLSMSYWSLSIKRDRVYTAV